eukprot:scaffold30254_cov107-Isochrysis_galbana.AAC.9
MSPTHMSRRPPPDEERPPAHEPSPSTQPLASHSRRPCRAGDPHVPALPPREGVGRVGEETERQRAAGHRGRDCG